MSFLANTHRSYDSPDSSTYSHSQLTAQNARSIVNNMASFDSLSAHHSAQSPDHRLPKVGETRCCQYSYYLLSWTIDRSFLYIPAFFTPSSASQTPPLTHFPFLSLLRLDTAFCRPAFRLSRPCLVLSSRRSSGPFNRTAITQVCPPR